MHTLEEAYAAHSASFISKLAMSDNRKLAEWAVDRLDLCFKEQSLRDALGMSSEATHGYFKKLHQEYEHDLRENRFLQNPVISDDEAAALMARISIENELEELTTDKKFIIKCG